MMRRDSSDSFWILIFLLFVISYGVYPQTVPSNASQKVLRRITETDLFDFAWIGDPQISPDGATVVFDRVSPNQDRTGYDGSVWMVGIGGRQAPTQILTGKGVGDARWSPDGQWLVYRREGQLALYSVRTQTSHMLTSLKGGAGGPVWSPDGRRIAFLSSMPDQSIATSPPTPDHKSDVHIITDAWYHSTGRSYLNNTDHQHVFVIDVPQTADDNMPTPIQLTSGKLDDNEPVWSPDGTRIYYVNAPKDEQFTRRDLYYVGSNGGLSVKLTTIPMGGFHFAISPDGKRLAFHGALVTTPPRSYSQFDLWTIDLKPDASPRDLTLKYDFDMNNTVTGDNNASVRTAQTLHWSQDGRYIYDLSSEKGRTYLVRVNTQNDSVEKITKGDQAVIDFSVTPDASKFITTISNPVLNADLFVVTPDGTQRRITDVNKDLWAKFSLTMPEEITYRSFDGREIQGWIQKPPDFDSTRKYPLVLEIHGGPHGAYGWTFNHEIQLLAARGYVVLYVNPRGSWGYGQEFGNIIQYNFPGDDAKDLLAGVDEILKRGYIDPKRLGVAGGSAGGALCDWLVGHTDRFAAAVSSRDISNFETFWYTTSSPTVAPLWFKRPPFEDPESYRSHSPITYVKNVHTPIMFVEGEDDHNAPSYAGGEQLFRALKYLNRSTVMLIFPRENHGLHAAGEPWHRVERLQHILAWFDMWMLGVPHPEYGLMPKSDLRK